MFFWIAAAVSAATLFVHVVFGGKEVARPLLADENLPSASKWLNYYCWHITSITIAFIAFAFVYLALAPEGGGTREAAVFLTMLTASLSVLSAAVAIKARIQPLRFPSTMLFALTALCGVAGLFGM